MFTGIIDHVGIVAAIYPMAKGLRVKLQTQFDDLTLGESISVEGICLTVNEIAEQAFYCDLSPETLRLTTAANFREGQQINLERALRPSDRLGGHFVLGHIDKMLVVKFKQQQADYTAFTFSFAPEDKSLLIPKGSIAINGISLTINDSTEEAFQVMIVPHTLQHTNLANLHINDYVNVEFDYLAKIIKQQVT